MARMRRRDRMKDDPVGDLAAVKAGLDEAAMSYQSAEKVSPGMFPMPAGYGDMPSGDVMKTDAASFTSVVEDVPGAAPRAGKMPEGVGSMGGSPKAPRPARKRDTPMFAVGAKGAGVGDLQEFLKRGGYYQGEIDSDFGGQTKAAVEAYQRDKGLKDDGMVGTKTMDAIEADMDGGSPAAAPAAPAAPMAAAPAAPAAPEPAVAAAAPPMAPEVLEFLVTRGFMDAETAEDFGYRPKPGAMKKKMPAAASRPVAQPGAAAPVVTSTPATAARGQKITREAYMAMDDATKALMLSTGAITAADLEEMFNAPKRPGA